MALAQEIERKIEDFRELGIPKYIPRKVKLQSVENMVSTIIGARRAGKSFRAMQAADEMAAHGIISSVEQVCMMDLIILSCLT